MHEEHPEVVLPTPVATLVLCGTLVAAFLVQIAFHATGSPEIARLGATTPWFWETGAWWTLFSATLLHFGVIHLAANLYFTWMIGKTLEHGIGGARMLVVFFVGGLVGSGLSVVVLPDYVSAGASGGAWGLMIALFLLLQFPFMRQGTRIRGAPVGPLLQLIGLNAVFSLLPGVNGLAHFGGGVGGGLALLITRPRVLAVPLAGLLYLAHGAALGWAVYDGGLWRDEPVAPLVGDERIEALEGLVRVLHPEGLTYQELEEWSALSTHPERTLVTNSVALTGPVEPEAMLDDMAAQLGTTLERVPCPGPCVAGRGQLENGLIASAALRTYGPLSTSTLWLVRDDVDGMWLTEATQGTRLTEAGLRLLVERAAQLSPEASEAALEAARADHPGSQELSDPAR